jgi:hypothetical protein
MSSQDNLSVIPEISNFIFYFTPLFILMSNVNRLGHTKCQDVDLTLPNKFHEWFHRGVDHWLCLSQYKALHWIQKAVRLDSMVPVYTDTKHSSSACDILLILEQVTIMFYSNYGDCIPILAGTVPFYENVLDFLLFLLNEVCSFRVVFKSER